MTALLLSDAWGRGHRGFGGGVHPFMALLCLIALGAVIGLVIGYFRTRHNPAPAAAPMPPNVPHTLLPISPTANAEAILAERLARSEISPEDYRTMLAALREANPPT